MPRGVEDGEGVRRQHIAVMAMAAAGAMTALAGCSGGSSDGATLAGDPIKTHHHHKPPTPSVTPTATPTPQVTVTVTPTPSRSASPSAPPSTLQNLAVTPAVRSKLIKAGAATHQLPAKDFTGLVPGLTYYAYDPATAAYWAGAGLVPSTSSEDAQISVQDDGSYLIFKRSSTGGWTGYNVGLAGIAGATCPVKPPKAITSIWHWSKGSCRPPSE
jgi:hypothetical protein